MECQSNCSCQNSDDVSAAPSRRSVLGVMAAAAVAIPMLGQAVRAEDAPASGGWVKTVKPSELADKSGKVIKGADMKGVAVLVRDGKTIQAMSSKCTHKGCDVNPVAGKTTLHCKCHGAEFAFTGANTRGPGKGDAVAATLKPLSHFALRLNADGVIEVNTSKPVDKDAPEATLTVSA